MAQKDDFNLFYLRFSKFLNQVWHNNSDHETSLFYGDKAVLIKTLNNQPAFIWVCEDCANILNLNAQKNERAVMLFINQKNSNCLF